MSEPMEIPEWVGSTLTNGAFLDYAAATRDAYVGIGLEDLSLTAIGMQLIEAVDTFRLAVNRQSAYDETADVVRADMAFYRRLGFQRVESFACYLGADYRALYGLPDLTSFRADG